MTPPEPNDPRDQAEVAAKPPVCLSLHGPVE